MPLRNVLDVSPEKKFLRGLVRHFHGKGNFTENAVPELHNLLNTLNQRMAFMIEDCLYECLLREKNIKQLAIKYLY